MLQCWSVEQLRCCKVEKLKGWKVERLKRWKGWKVEKKKLLLIIILEFATSQHANFQHVQFVNSSVCRCFQCFKCSNLVLCIVAPFSIYFTFVNLPTCRCFNLSILQSVNNSVFQLFIFWTPQRLQLFDVSIVQHFQLASIQLCKMFRILIVYSYVIEKAECWKAEFNHLQLKSIIVSTSQLSIFKLFQLFNFSTWLGNSYCTQGGGAIWVL